MLSTIYYSSIHWWVPYNQGHVSFTLEELKGVPGDIVSGYAMREDGNKVVYDVTFKTPDIIPLVRFYSTPLALMADSIVQV